MVAELLLPLVLLLFRCSLAKISMVAERDSRGDSHLWRCSLAKISMVAEPDEQEKKEKEGCSLAKISMVAEPWLDRLIT